MIRGLLVRLGFADSLRLQELRAMGSEWLVIPGDRSERCVTRFEALCRLIEPVIEQGVPAYERERLETWPAP